jgi:hypothetical protein
MKPGVKAGIFVGILSVVCSVVLYILDLDLNEKSRLIAYVFMIAAPLFGVLFCKKELIEGMRFSEGFQTAIQASMVAAIIGVVYFFFYIHFLRPDFQDTILDIAKKEMIDKGINGAQLDNALAMTKKFMNPMFGAAISIIMYALIGAIIGAISSAVMKNKD